MAKYVWTNTSKLLEQICAQILGTQVPMSTRRSVAVFYTIRVKDRTAALSTLFESGRYVPAIPLVRVAYEDWLSSAATLLAPADGSDPAAAFMDDLGAEYARLYRRFVALCGKKAANAQFPVHPPYAARWLRDKKDPPHKARDWSGKACSLGLQTVHDVAYNYLSDLAHGSFHALGEYVGTDGPRIFEKPLTRDPEREELLAIWAFWFQLRTLTLAGSEWGLDFEHLSDGWLAELQRQGKGQTVSTCVARKEMWDTA